MQHRQHKLQHCKLLLKLWLWTLLASLLLKPLPLQLKPPPLLLLKLQLKPQPPLPLPGRLSEAEAQALVDAANGLDDADDIYALLRVLRDGGWRASLNAETKLFSLDPPADPEPVKPAPALERAPAIPTPTAATAAPPGSATISVMARSAPWPASRCPATR